MVVDGTRIETVASAREICEMLKHPFFHHPLSSALRQRQVPFVFYTGNPDPLHDRWPTAPVIGKPATAAAIVGAIKYVHRLSGRA